ncbi:hypothetical protein [Streptomyces sp. NPDC005407]|uniref:hypothetical protein n=1 Tax=Streptomyces sp. NPDC005407 TaxID=3155340 RepID=UPI0033BF14E4
MDQDRTRSISSIPPTSDDSSQANEALRRTVAGQIGPRKPGVVYDNADGIFEVIGLTLDRSEARRVLKRRAAQFAITVHDRITGTVDTIGTVWTGSDRVLKAVA